MAQAVWLYAITIEHGILQVIYTFCHLEETLIQNIQPQGAIPLRV